MKKVYYPLAILFLLSITVFGQTVEVEGDLKVTENTIVEKKLKIGPVPEILDYEFSFAGNNNGALFLRDNTSMSPILNIRKTATPFVGVPTFSGDSGIKMSYQPIANPINTALNIGVETAATGQTNGVGVNLVSNGSTSSELNVGFNSLITGTGRKVGLYSDVKGEGFNTGIYSRVESGPYNYAGLFYGNLEVRQGSVYFENGLRVGSNLYVTSDIYTESDLTVQGETALVSDVTAYNNVTVGKDLTVNDDVTIADDATIEGTTRVKTLVVGNHNYSFFTDLRGGTFIVGPDNNSSDTNPAFGVMEVEVTFPAPFNKPPKLIITASNQLGQSFNDAFSVTTKLITETKAVLNIVRLDQEAFWSQYLRLDYMAFTF